MINIKESRKAIKRGRGTMKGFTKADFVNNYSRRELTRDEQPEVE